MKLKLTSVLSLLLITNYVNTLNILGIFPYEGKSHFFVFRLYLRELANRGHNVTVISHFPEQEPPANYSDISLAGSIKIVEDNLPVQKSYWAVFAVGIFLANSGINNCKVMLANKQVQDLIKQQPNFDVIVVEQFNSDCALGIAYKLGAPVVGMSSHILMPYHYKRLGIPNNPSFVPFHFLEGGTRPTLYQRVERVLFDAFFRSLYYLLTQRSDQKTLAEYFDDIPPLEDLARDMKFHLLYHNFVLTGSRLFPANVIEVGGYHVGKAKPLIKDLKKFVDEAEHGIIYISFGSVIKSSTMPADKLEAVLGAMTELPQRFIWKWEDKVLTVDKNKLYVSDWLPQVDILGHPKTLAFLSHAGMGGTTEAIHFGVPVVATPFVGDQPANAAAIEESGLGIQLQIEDYTKENLLAAFKKVLDPTVSRDTLSSGARCIHFTPEDMLNVIGGAQPMAVLKAFTRLFLTCGFPHDVFLHCMIRRFQDKVKQVSKAWHDRPMSPLDTAIYWTEFAARHPNITFRTAAADTPFYQYIHLDIAIIIITLFIIILLICKVIRVICCKSKNNKVAKKSKRQ